MIWNWITSGLICMCGINGPATAYEPAVRLDTPAPVDLCDSTRRFVNSLPYEWGNLDPVRTAYSSVAANCLDWSPATITQWEAFLVDDVIKEESGGCWNVYRKGLWNGTGCDFRYPNGSASDAGFFQLISVWHGPNGYLCVNFGTCGREAVTASPFDSMISGLRAVMHDGSRPWCYNAQARAFHRGCATVPRHWS